MTKDEIAGHIADKAELTKERAHRALNVLLDLIHVELRSGRDFALRDIGTLKVKHMGARVGRNPATGEPIQIKARRTVKLAISTGLSSAMNG